jgi:competence protein ComEA
MNFQELLAKNKVPFIFLLSGVILITFGFLYPKISQLQTNNPPVLKKATLAIDVGGAVKEPGVYQLEEAVRVEDAIKKAGGFSDTADLTWVSKNLNLAQNVKDEMKIYIPRRGELVVASSSTTLKGPTGGVLGVSSLINVNFASQAELDQLPGIGAVTSQKIIAGRPFLTISELKDKKIVSGSVYEKIKDLVKTE